MIESTCSAHVAVVAWEKYNIRWLFVANSASMVLFLGFHLLLLEVCSQSRKNLLVVIFWNLDVVFGFSNRLLGRSPKSEGLVLIHPSAFCFGYLFLGFSACLFRGLRIGWHRNLLEQHSFGRSRAQNGLLSLSWLCRLSQIVFLAELVLETLDGLQAASFDHHHGPVRTLVLILGTIRLCLVIQLERLVLTVDCSLEDLVLDLRNEALLLLGDQDGLLVISKEVV